MNKGYSIKLKTIIKVNGEVSSVLPLQDGRLATSIDNIIFIYNCINWKCELIIKGHIDTIISLQQLPNGKLISLSNIIKIHNISNNNYYCEYTYNQNIQLGDFNEISIISNNIIATTNENNYLTFWNSIPPYDIIKKKKLKYQPDTIYKLQEKNVLLVNSFEKWKINFYDLDNYKKILSLKNICCSGRDGLVETERQKLIIVENPSSQEMLFHLFIVNLKNFNLEFKIAWEVDILNDICDLIEISDNFFIFRNAKGLFISNPLGFNMTLLDNQKGSEILKLIKINKNEIILIYHHKFTISQILTKN